MEVTVNQSQRLFIISTGQGYSTASFDFIYRQSCALRDMLKSMKSSLMQRLQITGPATADLILDRVRKSEIGTLEQYRIYQELLEFASTVNLGTWFDPETPEPVRKILESYRASGRSLRLFYGDTQTGRDWLEENDVIGRIGRSSGILKVPLLLTDGDIGGGAILDRRIVRIIDVDSGKELYRQANYFLPEMGIEHGAGNEASPSHPVAVVVNNAPFANFRTSGKAAAWIAFMSGESMTKPE